MRERGLGRQSSLVAGFRDRISLYPGTECLLAPKGAQAAEFVRTIAADSRNIVINRSATVTNELKPHLANLGFRIIEPYNAEPDYLENRIADYWDLPGLLGKGLIPGFEQHPINGGLGLEDGIRDFVAVLGVSAACADDGSVFFVQHSSNISRTLQEARQVVLVVALDKVVETRADATLQTECMGVFGLEAMLLNLRHGRNDDFGLDSLPAVEPTGRRFHVILLDNGRTRILASNLRELMLCIGCRRCVAQCPINHFMGHNGDVWSPRDHLFMFLLGQNPLMDACLHCEACRVECPLSIDLPGLMWLARADHAASHGRSLGQRLLGHPEALARMGSFTAPVSNTVADSKPARALIGAALGFDPRRSLPRFHRQTFARSFTDKKRTAADRIATSRAKVAYFAGCYANYYQPELAGTVANVLNRNNVDVAVPGCQCCGMPMIANNNMIGFRKNAERNIRSFASFINDGWDVVTACPSCALMLKHGYPAFFGQDDADLVSRHVYYVDEYLVRLTHKRRLPPGLVQLDQSVLCHIPCHLKVQDEGRSTLDLLHSIPGLSVAAVNAACCGMGGYHGYKKAYSDLSLEMGRKLFQDIEETGADRVVTGCAACGLQIRYGTGIAVIHPVQLLEMAYGPDREGHSQGRLA